MNQMKSLAWLCVATCQPLVNYRDKWRDYHFNGPGALVHISGEMSQPLFAPSFQSWLGSAPHTEATIKYNQLLSADNAPSLYHNFGNDGALMDRGNINFFVDGPSARRRRELASRLTPSYLSDDTAEKDKVKQAADCCRKILNHVNQAVKESEDKQVRRFWTSPFCFIPSHPLSQSHHQVLPLLSTTVSSLSSPPLLLGQWIFSKSTNLHPLLSLLFSVLPPEVGGLSEKTGPLVFEANRQPRDPGAEGEFSTSLFEPSVKAQSCVYRSHTQR